MYASQKFRPLAVSLIFAVSGCVEPGPVSPSAEALVGGGSAAAQARVLPSMAAALGPLVHLTTFETPPGLSPDDLAFLVTGGPRLLAVAVNPTSAMYEMTLEGGLITTYPEYGSFSLTRGTNGPVLDHAFQMSGGGTNITVAEFDRQMAWLRNCNVDVSGAGTLGPFDAMAYHHHRETLVGADFSADLLVELDCSRGDRGILVRTVPLQGFPAPTGMVYDVGSRTYWGVLHLSSELVEFDEDGHLIRRIDLVPYGVQQPVGVTLGQGKLFIADELKGDLNDTTGFIYVFRVPRP